MARTAPEVNRSSQRAGCGTSLAVIGCGIAWLAQINPGTVIATGILVAGSFFLGQGAPSRRDRISPVRRVPHVALFALFTGALGAIWFGVGRVGFVGMSAIAIGAYLIGQSTKRAGN